MGWWDDIGHYLITDPISGIEKGAKTVASHYMAGLRRATASGQEPLITIPEHIAKGIWHLGGPGAPAKKAPPKKKNKKAATVPKETIVKAYEQAIETGPYAKIEQETAKEFAPAFQAANQYASGAEGAAATTGAYSQALEALSGAQAATGGTTAPIKVGGVTLPGTAEVAQNTPKSWLASSLGAAAAVDAPVTQAMAGYGAAQEKFLPSVLSALNAMGQGEELGVATATGNAWLNALISHVSSNLAYYGVVPSAAVSAIPSPVAEALKAAGGPAGGTGVASLTTLTTKGPVATVKRGATSTTGVTTAEPPGVTAGQATRTARTAPST